MRDPFFIILLICVLVFIGGYIVGRAVSNHKRLNERVRQALRNAIKR